MVSTKIRIRRDTRRRLARLKTASGDTYDSLVNKLLLLIPEGDDEGLYADAFRNSLREVGLGIRNDEPLSRLDRKRRLNP